MADQLERRRAGGVDHRVAIADLEVPRLEGVGVQNELPGAGRRTALLNAQHRDRTLIWVVGADVRRASGGLGHAVSVHRDGAELEHLRLNHRHAFDACEQLDEVVVEGNTHQFPLAELQLGTDRVLGVAVDVFGETREGGLQTVGEHERADCEHHPESHRRAGEKEPERLARNVAADQLEDHR